MFTRKVYMRLKPNSVAQFTEKLGSEVLPLLRRQNGFQDEITFVGQSGTEAFGISLWDTAESAERYNRGTYPSVSRTLAPFSDGVPHVETFNVANSTFHEIACAVTAQRLF